jgi:hypothetical protein
MARAFPNRTAAQSDKEIGSHELTLMAAMNLDPQ